MLGSNIASFILGKLTERARTERKIKKIREQIVILYNRSVQMEDRYNKLLYTCAIYSLLIKNARKSDNEKVKELTKKYNSIFKFMKDSNVPLGDRIKVRFSLFNAKRNLLKEVI